MFNRTFIVPGRTRTEYVTREIHEHRAPTDESVKLLREMEDAADAKRIATMRMPGNTFEGVVEVWETNHDAGRHARAIFDLNGARCTAEVSGTGFEGAPELLERLRQRTAEVVAAKLLASMCKGLQLPRRLK